MQTLDTRQFKLHLPPRQIGAGLDQDEEWCEIELRGKRRRIRLHDYAAIYDVPGLYERLFYDRLACNSPKVVCDLLGAVLQQSGVDAETLAALDLGAGNGMVGELLGDLGVDSIVGIDLLPEARAAAMRDRPGLYDDYLALDLGELRHGERAALAEHNFELMTCVAALGFGDIPPRVFADALNLVTSPGWVAFNLREHFLDEEHPAGFGRFIRRMLAEGVLEERARKSYTHRVSVAAEPLTYLALVATKRRNVPPDWAA